ncbi:MAG: hypothetical protein LBR85_00495 [Oscillospiraceae bacterium]|jgi:hypothetical protein|nr:hypothetical protein [Oscillospiraceae bacterium]
MLRQNNPDDERFPEIVSQARLDAANLLPEWSDFNTHDPGVTLIDLMAWLTEAQRFHMSASERADAFFPLLGITPRRARPAVAEVTLPHGTPVRIPSGTPVMAEDIRFETAADIPACPGKALSFRVIQKHTVFGGLFDSPERPVLGVADGFPGLSFTVDTRAQSVLHESFSLAVSGSGGLSGAQTWTAVDDFRLSGSADTHFTLDDESGVVSFGDGIRGLAPKGEVRIVSMALTRGEGGNITSGQLTEMRVGERLLTLVQEKPAQGGARRESPGETLTRMEEERRQAVTAEDIRLLVLETPGTRVEDARVFAPENRPGGGRPRIIVIAAKVRGAALAEEHKRAIRLHLEPYRLAGFDFAIRALRV